MHRPFVVLLIAFAGLTAQACAGPGSPRGEGGLPEGTIAISTTDATVELHVEIAETQAAREHGLMDRTELPADEGMAFLFPTTYTGGFWMKNTLIPLSIAFWDSSNRIVDILEMTPCKQDQCRLYVPKSGYVGAVEANEGFFADNGIGVGDSVELSR